MSGCLLALTLAHLRTEAITSGSRLTESLAKVIEEQTTRTFQSTEQTLQLTALRLAQLELSGRLNEDSARQLLRQELQSLPFARIVWVTDAKGRLIYDTNVGNIGADLSATEYFRELQARPQTPFLIGTPAKSRLDGKWLIPVALPLKTADGRFKGTLATAVDPLYFDALWKTIDLRTDGAVTLFRRDGVLMMRSPFDDSTMGKRYPNAVLFKDMLPRSPAGSFQSVSSIDGIARMFAYRSLSAQPEFVAVVGLSYDVLLKPWRDLAALAAAIWLVAAACGTLMCLFLARAWRRQVAAQTEAGRLAHRLRLATDAASVGIWDWDIARTDQWYASPTYFTMLGYDPEEGFADRQQWIERLHPEDREAVNARIQAVLAGADLPYEYEARLRHADGRYRWVRVVGRVLARDAEGKAIRLMGVRLDITAQKQSEEKLRQSEQSLSITLNSIGDAVIATDTAGHIVRMNPTAERLTGWPLSEATGKPLTEVFRIINAQTRAPSLNPVQLVIEKGEVVGLANHTALLARDGPEYQIFDSAAPIRDAGGQIVGVVLVFSDVTEQYRVREALATNVELLERIGELAKVGGWDRDLRTMQSFWSAETCRIHDLDPSTTPSQDEAISFYAPEARPTIAAAVQAAIDDGTAWDLELPVITAKGRHIWVRTQGFPVMEDGRAVKLVGAFHDITEHRMAQIAVRQSDSRYRTLFEYAPDGIVIADSQSYYLDANDSICRMLGYTREELIGLHASDIVMPTEVPYIGAALQAIQTAPDYHREWQFRRKDGSTFPAEVIATGMPDGNLMAMIRDVTDRKQAENALRESALHTQSILDNMVDGVITLNAQGEVASFNQAACSIFGYTPEEVIGRSATLFLSGPDQDNAPNQLADQFADIAQGRSIVARELEVWRKDGSLFPIHLSMSRVSRDGQATLIAIVRDITQQRQDEEEIRRLAFYDSLTGLPNRRLLMERLKQAIVTSHRTGKHGALMFLDLDHFKLLNDTQGHDVGDLLLRQVALRLQACVRDGDSVARLGGDEFVILLEALSTQPHEAATQAEVIATKLLDIFHVTFNLNGYRYDSTPSIGIVVFSGNAETMDDLLKKADLAMYQGKSAGRNTARFFDPAMQAAVAAHEALEKDLRRGLLNQEFVLHYQIQVNRQGEPIGAEALVRWNHAEKGLITPYHFIALAEQTGLILPLGQWVLVTACSQLVIWAADPRTAAWTLAVNVSASQFAQADFVANVAYALQATGANPQRLKLELTESLLVHDVEDVIVKMTAIKAFGVGFSLDDFGTGYSSLSYLKRLPLDQLKIDQSFVRDLMTDASDAVIARTILALGHSLGLTVIAEGVETAGQRDFLADMGCDAFQGYFFGRPAAADTLG
ncbi:GGDEF domain-containing protein [Rhodoferax saidenbachensis]|uniref:GGDEF domain-containing protein n=1 Tax=Rhodoferax saidenbachensis TaxID=1484693 RepID=A0A1P8KBD5_9BURK|nr:GGDEF domain-containing protein [Rhodoferax saidenbachensis]